MQTGEVIERTRIEGLASDLVLTPDGRFILVGTQSGYAQVLSAPPPR